MLYQIRYGDLLPSFSQRRSGLRFNFFRAELIFSSGMLLIAEMAYFWLPCVALWWYHASILQYQLHALRILSWKREKITWPFPIISWKREKITLISQKVFAAENFTSIGKKDEGSDGGTTNSIDPLEKRSKFFKTCHCSSGQ